MMGAMVHRWVLRATLAATVGVVVACDGSAGASPAVRGPWQARPFDHLDAGLAHAAETTCRTKTPQAAGLPVLLHDQRGAGIDTVVFGGPNGQAFCQVSKEADGDVLWLTSSANSGPPSQIPAPLGLLLDSMGSSSGSDVETVSTIDGRTGAGIVSVRILLTDGSEVVATALNGAFYAWWPGEALAATLFGDDASGRMVATATP
jgi:hypothetical protein